MANEPNDTLPKVVNQSITHSMNGWMNESMNRTISQAIDQSIDGQMNDILTLTSIAFKQSFSLSSRMYRSLRTFRPCNNCRVSAAWMVSASRSDAKSWFNDFWSSVPTSSTGELGENAPISPAVRSDRFSILARSSEKETELPVKITVLHEVNESVYKIDKHDTWKNMVKIKWKANLKT